MPMFAAPTWLTTTLCALLLYSLPPTQITDAIVPLSTSMPLTNSSTLPLSKPYVWGLINDDSSHWMEERAAGITDKVVRISWKDFAPTEGATNTEYVAAMRAQFDGLRQRGLGVILELGIQDTPTWVRTNYPDTGYVDQYGDVYSGQGQPDSGDADAVFNSTVRGLIAAYVRAVFTAFGSDFAAVRLGAGHWGELTYPTHTYNGHTNCYWAFDRDARAQSPVPTWSPGSPSPNGEAARFITWYLDALAGYEDWQIGTLRQSYAGPIMMLFPGWGIRPGQVSGAIADNLDGSTSTEINGEIQAGTDYARQIAAIHDAKTIVETTWLDAPYGNDTDANPTNWRPVHYLASLASSHQPALAMFGENTGQGQRAQMDFSVAQMQTFGLMGMAWYDETELFSGHYATLGDYQADIAVAGSTPPSGTATPPTIIPTIASTVALTMPITATVMPTATASSNPRTTRSPTPTLTATATSVSPTETTILTTATATPMEAAMPTAWSLIAPSMTPTSLPVASPTTVVSRETSMISATPSPVVTPAASSTTVVLPTPSSPPAPPLDTPLATISDAPLIAIATPTTVRAVPGAPPTRIMRTATATSRAPTPKHTKTSTSPVASPSVVRSASHALHAASPRTASTFPPTTSRPTIPGIRRSRAGNRGYHHVARRIGNHHTATPPPQRNAHHPHTEGRGGGRITRKPPMQQRARG